MHAHGLGVAAANPDAASDYMLKALVSGHSETYLMLVREKGETVPIETRKALQSALKREGFYTGKIDGSFGPGTLNALLAFMKAKAT